MNKIETILPSNYREKKYTVMIGGQNFFDQPIRNNLITYGNIWKILQIIKAMITQLIVFWTIIISKSNVRW